MNKYGEAAIKAVKVLESNKISPLVAWEIAVTEIFSNNASSCAKACPRNAFLALCETGIVNNIPPGLYTKSKMNKSYVLEGLTLLREDSQLADDINKLWKMVIGNQKKVHNHQMNVLVSLWKNGLIKY
ncbi:hypothetical protein BHU72_01945 [Desulfuribacillus stibiiarsenatis]|uniref:Uncharacterized protein n=1 Tax=Desulfuribacillus stibiiarsenatis TaxID=1390249 RepID=A0A1E5L628_9FIRM|nr:hypothetical protein [Desulfuribacillus stibiiarsenatis]OEH85585.1 hypothetical protein BHU72_01945 [Desulfuribacillus stibiiarsenatis]